MLDNSLVAAIPFLLTFGTISHVLVMYLVFLLSAWNMRSSNAHLVIYGIAFWVNYVSLSINDTFCTHFVSIIYFYISRTPRYAIIPTLLFSKLKSGQLNVLLFYFCWKRRFCIQNKTIFLFRILFYSFLGHGGQLYIKTC